MSELIILIAAVITNAITGVVKPKDNGLTETQKEMRKKILRAFSALVAIISAVGTAWIMGEPVDVSSIEGSVVTILTFAATWISSQGTYFLAKTFNSK